MVKMHLHRWGRPARAGGSREIRVSGSRTVTPEAIARSLDTVVNIWVDATPGTNSRLNEIAGSDFNGLGDVSQFCDNEFATARKSLILKRRDVGVVDRARLEVNCARAC